MTEPVELLGPATESSHHGVDWSERLLMPALVVFLIAKTWLTWGRYLNQDEFETLHQGWLMYSGAIPYRDYRSNHPPLAFELLGALNHIVSDPVWIIRIARTATLLAASLTLWLVYRIGRDVFGSAAGRWAVIAYAVNATFWEWSTEVRTDFLMVPLWLSGVSLLFSPRPRSVTLRMIVIGLCLGSAFWVNQKVVLHAAPVGLLMLVGGPDRTWRARDVFIAVASSLLPALLVLGRAAANGSLIDFLDNNFLGSCAWGMLSTHDYRGWRLVTLQRAFWHDGAFVLLSSAAAIWACGPARSRAQFFMSIAAVWMLFTLFLTPGPLPYYMLSVFPLAAVVLGGFLADLCSKIAASEPPVRREAVWIGIAVIVFAFFPMRRMTKFIWPTNRYQLDVVHWADQWIPEETRVFDGAGTLVTRPDAYPYHWVLWKPELDAYRAGHLPPLIPTLRKNECRVLVDTYRVRSLPEHDRHVLKTQFVHLWGPIRVAGFDSLTTVGPEPHEFELWYDGVYVSSRPDTLVDGKPMTSPRFLTAGRHTVQLTESPGRVILRDTSIGPQGPVPVDGTDPTEFLGKYGYGY